MSEVNTVDTNETDTQAAAATAGTPSKRGRGRTSDPNSSLSKAKTLFNSRSWANAKEYIPVAQSQLGINQKVASTYYYLAKKAAALKAAAPTATV